MTSRDLAFLVYFYPLRWLVLLFGPGVLRLACASADLASPVASREGTRRIEKKMMTRLGVSRECAQRLAREFLSNRVRAALFDLAVSAKPAGLRPVRLEGGEHLDRVLASGRGLVVLTLHTLAKREARLGLRRMGIEVCPVANGPNRQFMHHGRLLWRVARRKMLSLQFSTLGAFIDRDDPDVSFQILRMLRDGGIVVMAPEVSGSSSVRQLPFLGKTVPISTGALEVARLAGCDVMPMWVRHSGEDCVVEFRPPLALRFETRTADEEKWNFAQLVGAMEEQMRAHPEQWEFWDRDMPMS